MSKYKRNSKIRHKKIQARFPTVIYTLFGAFIVPRSGEATVGSLVRLTKPLGFSENAIRLGLSRMSRKGVFKIRKKGRSSLYSLSKKGMKWMEAGRVRAFEFKYEPWDQKWRLVIYSVPEALRDMRGKLRFKLHSLGFANLSASLWISPYDLQSGVDKYVSDRGIGEYVETFEARYTGRRREREMAAMIWNIKDMEKRYGVFIRKYSALYERHRAEMQTRKTINKGVCFAQRFCLTAEYVALRLEDPMLPLELLPKNWKGIKAQRLFSRLRDLLSPAADDFVDAVLNT
jgi:phenylacetic acid degradation operon negative regulatory protein